MPLRQAILFIIDTQGANCVGCYRPDGLPLGTPNLDRLAASGVRFDRAYCCSPVCSPARSAILTGLYPHSNGVLANDMALHLDVPTLGQRLQAAGVATGYIGKWHLDGTDYFGSGVCPPGWDPGYWFDGRNYLDSLPDSTARALSRRMLTAGEVAAEGITSEFTHAHRIADRAIEFIARHRERDFLLVVSIDEPHHPFICPEPYVSAFDGLDFPVPNADDDLTGKPQGQREWAEFAAPALARHLVRRSGPPPALRYPAYFSCNSYSDAQVGRVLAAAAADAPAAMVVYTADHGDMFGSHGLWGKGAAVYEEITRVPLLVSLPGQAPAGSVDGGLASHIDLVPTVLEHFALKVPPLLQGRSLLARCRQPGPGADWRVFVEFNRFEVDHDSFGAFAPMRCILDGRHKLAVNLLDTDELYVLADDPGEMRNRIAEPALGQTRDRLHAELLEWMKRTRDPMRGPAWERRAWSTRTGSSSWRGPTRPRPADPDWLPRTLLYETAEPVDRDEYEKH